jgi:hypothetical protein
MVRDEPMITEAFRTGKGVGWHERDSCLFRGTERFFRPGYMRHLLSEWIPALDGVQAKLEAGGSAADVGCGHGASTILMAQAFPKSRFYGFDYHALRLKRRVPPPWRRVSEIEPLSKWLPRTLTLVMATI